MSIRGLEIISVKLFLWREITGILSWYGMRLDKNTKKCEVISEQNPNFCLGIKGQKLVSTFFISATNTHGILCSNHTRHLTAPQYHCKHSSNFFFRHITLPGILSLSHSHLYHQAKPHFIFKVHHKWWGLLEAFPKQQTTFSLPIYSLPEFCFYVYFRTYTLHLLNTV